MADAPSASDAAADAVSEGTQTTFLSIGDDNLRAVCTRIHERDLLPFMLACTEFLEVVKSLADDGKLKPHPVSTCISTVARARWALDELDCPWLIKKSSAVCARAAACGDVDVLQLLHDDLGYPWGELSCAEAAASGRLDTLRFLRARSCPWSEATSSSAARNGHLDILRYCLEQYHAGETNGREPWNARTCGHAAEGGHQHVLEFLRVHGCAWDADVTWRAARGGHLELIQWARKQDPPAPWDGRACEHAAKANRLGLLRWLHANGCPWSHSTCTAAAGQGHLDVLQFARAQVPPCPFGVYTSTAAASGGHLAVLRWLRAEGCPWDGGCSFAAAKLGNLEMLQWLSAEGCPIKFRATVGHAARNGQLAILRWMREQYGEAVWWPGKRALAEWAQEWPAILDWLGPADEKGEPLPPPPPQEAVAVG